jgi:hypothetical protein
MKQARPKNICSWANDNNISLLKPYKMKKTFLSLIFFYSLTTLGYGQHCDPRTPPGSTVNIWDWRIGESYTVYLDLVNSGNIIEREIESPFHPPAGILTYQPNVAFIRNTAPLDYQPSDGWELIAKNFGTPTIGVRIPSFYLYNRYEGKLRTFHYVSDLDDAEKIFILLQSMRNIDGILYVSALLEHINTPLSVIEDYTDENITISAPNIFVGNSGTWLSTDVPIAYDPCVCQHLSGLFISTRGFDSQDLDLKLTGEGEIEQIFTQGTAIENNGGGFNVSGAFDATEKGNKYYKSSSSFINSLEKSLVNIANRNITNNQNNLAQDFQNLGIPYPNNLSKSQLYELIGQLNAISYTASGLSAESAKKISDTLFPEAVSSVLPKWIKEVVPFAGLAIGFLDFVIGGGKKAQPIPMQFHANFEFEGTGMISNNIPLGSDAVYTPGSDNLTAPQAGKIPIYNNPLGIMNVVDRIKIMTAHAERFVDIYAGSGIIEHRNSWKIKDDLVYALNPASGLTIVDMKASIRLYGCDPAGYLSVFGGDEAWPLVFGNTLHREFKHPGDFDYLRTPYLPIACLKEYSFINTFAGNPGGGNCTPEVALHVIAKLSPTSGPNVGEEVTFAALYKVDIENAPYTFEETPQNPYAEIPENVRITELDDNIFAWNNLIVDEPINFSNEELDQVNALAGGGEIERYEIKVVEGDGTNPGYTVLEPVFTPSYTTGGTLEPGTILSNVPNCGTIPPVGAEYLNAFCNDVNRYDPVAAIQIPNEDDKDIGASKIKDIIMFPNPASNDVNISFFNEIPQPIEINIIDGLGRNRYTFTKEDPLPVGQVNIHLDCTALSPGQFFVQIKGTQIFENLPLIIQK